MKQERFGVRHGTPIHGYWIENSAGMRARFIEYGATTTDLIVPDRDGNTRNVVLGYRNLEDYLAGKLWFGATAGRVAGRITEARFRLGGRTYRLERNDPPNCLHGGSQGLDKKRWNGRFVASPEGEAVAFRYTSPGGESGFPGTLKLCARFTILRNADTLRIEYFAETDEPTPVNLINHCYFNLDGDDGTTVDDHRLSIDADHYTPAGEAMTLLGRVEPVAGRPVDLRRPRRIGDIVPGLFNRHGDNYIVNAGTPDHRTTDIPVPVAWAYSPTSGITMEVATNRRCVQFFGGEYIPARPESRCGRPYGPRAGFCLESQDYPDGVNHPEITDPVVEPARPYYQITEWSFS